MRKTHTSFPLVMLLYACFYSSSLLAQVSYVPLYQLNEPAPVTGTFSRFNASFNTDPEGGVSSADQLHFVGEIRDWTSPGSFDWALVTGPQNGFEVAAVESVFAPGIAGDWFFDDLDDPAVINASGQFAFLTSIDLSGSPRQGIWVGMPGSLMPVAIEQETGAWNGAGSYVLIASEHRSEQRWYDRVPGMAAGSRDKR